MEALQYLDTMRVIHLGKYLEFQIQPVQINILDLKPNNIVFTHKDKDNLNIKIIDFGLANDLADECDMPISTCGTPEFTSPEVIECGYASPKSDMWSLGVIVFMLTSGGVSPFYCRNSVQLEKNIVSGQVDFNHPELKNVTEEARNFIKCLLVVNTSLRWSASQCLKHKYDADLYNIVYYAR